MSENGEQISKPKGLFLAGTSRSGTELMRQVLNGHPQISLGLETHYFSDLRPRFSQEELEQPNSLTTKSAERYFELLRRGSYGLRGTERTAEDCPKLNSSAIDRAVSSRGIDAIFQHHCLSYAERFGKDIGRLEYWGEKTPRHIFNYHEIFQAFPDSKIIFMLRDPRAVCASYRNWTNYWVDRSKASAELREALEAEEQRIKLTGSIVGLSLLWRAAANSALRAVQDAGSERVLIVKFEELLEDSSFQIRRICAFLEVEPNPTMAMVKRTNSSFVQNGAISGFDKSAATGWIKYLSRREVATIDLVCRELIVNFGYLRSSDRFRFIVGICGIAGSSLSLPLAFWKNRRRMGRPSALLRRLLRSL